MAGDPLEAARRLSEEVLLPGALEVDGAEIVPIDRLDRLAEAGLYGLAGPMDGGGMGVDRPLALRIIEVLAGGCLTTTFVWMQHHGAVRAVAAAGGPLREEWLRPLCRGERRAGVAFSGLRRPGPPSLLARPAGGGWVLDGVATWVTGWGRIDVVHVGARSPSGEVVWMLVDAAPGPTLAADRLRLAAVNASATVTLRFQGHLVAEERVTGREPYAVWQERDRASLRTNGSLSLGVAARCAAMLASRPLDTAIARCRVALDRASVEEMPEARARASRLALDAATLLITAGGGRSILLDQHAQRLGREALFLLVFGQTPAIRQAQMAAYVEAGGEAARGLAGEPPKTSW